jgi:hypothetical protein
MIIVIAISLLIFLPILFGYYQDYKNNPNEFKIEFRTFKKGLTKILLFFIIYFGINKIYDLIFPLNKKNGIEFNDQRIKIGLPTLDDNWQIDKNESNQHNIIWWKAKRTIGHFKKVIKYRILNPETETDYYQSKNRETFLWSIYNFENKTFEYYIEKPNEKIISVTKKGNLKYEKPTVEIKITKTEFENNLNK